MADTNAQMEELARILEQVNHEMALYGRVTKQTADDIFDAKAKEMLGVRNATKGLDLIGGSASSLASAAGSAAKAMLDGKKGAAAFNDSIDDMSKAAAAAGMALSLMIPGGPLLKLFIAGVTAAVTAVAAYTKAANTMADQLYKTYSGLSKAGASASDGMSGVLKASNQLGLSMEEMDTFVGQITANSKDLALFSGSVFEGRQKLGDMGDALRGSREDFLKMGMSMTDVSEGMLGYLKVQTRVGLAQNKTTAELAEGAKKYLVEQDALTKLTGVTRKENEAALEEARSQQRFRAKLDAMRATGDEGQIAAAAELEKTYQLLRSQSKEAAQGFGDLTTGMMNTEAAQKTMMSTNGEAMQVASKMVDGQMKAIEGTQQIATAAGRVTKDMNMMYQTGAGEDFLLSAKEGAELGLLAQKDLNASYKKIKEDQKKTLEGTADPMLAKQAELINVQISANEGMKNFIAEGIEPAQKAMIVVAKASLAAAQALYRLVGGDSDKQAEVAKKNTDEMKQRGLVNESTTNDTGMDFGQLSGADGGVFKGPSTGYPVLMHGTEAIIPMDKLTGANKLGNFDQMFGGTNTPDQPVSTTPASATIKSLVSNLTTISKSMTTGSTELDDAFDEIVKDSQKIEKLTDADTKRAEKYNLAYKSYVDLKMQLMDLETPLIKNQLDQIQNSTGGEGSALGGGSAPSAGGGLKLPSMGNMPSMGGGQGVAGGRVASQNDLTKMGLKLKTGDVQSEGSQIDPKIIEMAQQVQANMPNFGYFSGFNDKFHQEKSPSSSHTTGRAMDFTLAQAPSIEEGQEITKWLKSMGASVAIDEYNNPSSKATAGHIHAQIAGYADGGVASTPQIAMVAEKGPEAMIPLDNGNIPIKLEMPDVKAMFDGMAKAFTDQADKSSTSSNGMSTTEIVDELKASRQQNFELLSLIQEMVKSQKDSTSIQERILQTSM
jgi:hypothetical protein